MNILVTLLIEYFLPNKLFKKRIFCLCFITYMGHLNLRNILFMFHHIHGTFKFREFGAAASNCDLWPVVIESRCVILNLMAFVFKGCGCTLSRGIGVFGDPYVQCTEGLVFH
jgi:hypothetical protein